MCTVMAADNSGSPASKSCAHIATKYNVDILHSNGIDLREISKQNENEEDLICSGLIHDLVTMKSDDADLANLIEELCTS